MLCMLLACWTGSAQPLKPLRAYLPVDPPTERIQVVNSPNAVFVVKSALKTTEVSVIRFDTQLKEVWAVGLQRSQEKLSMVKAMDDRLFLLMSDGSQKSWDVLELDEETGHYILSTFTLSRPFQLKEFVAYKDYMWCTGTINGEPAVFALDGRKGGAKALPIGYRTPILDVTSIAFDKQAKRLDMSLRSSRDKRSVFIQRSLDTEGRIIENVVFESPSGFNIKDFRFVEDSAGRQMAFATIYKGNYEQLKGLVTWHQADGEWQAVEHFWQAVPGLSQSLQIDSKDRALNVRKAKWESGWSRMDEPINVEHGIFVGLDRFEKQYNVRGTLQRQQDQDVLVTQLDQNQFGRRGFDVNETTLDDRLETFSNTDISTYQYRDVLVGPLEESGKAYAETWVLFVNWEGAVTGKIIKSEPKSFGAFADGGSPLETIEGRPAYFSARVDRLDMLHLEDKDPRIGSLQVPMGPFTQSWLPGVLLNFGFVGLEEKVYLFLQRYNFEEWSANSPGSQGH